MPPSRAATSGLVRRPQERLNDGTIGYTMIRHDDCLRAAVATALQVPPAEIPDPRIEQRLLAGEEPDSTADHVWTILAAWLAGRGLQIVRHEVTIISKDAEMVEPTNPPLADADQRWIGVVEVGEVNQRDIDAMLAGHPLTRNRAGRRAVSRQRALDGMANFASHSLVMRGWDLLFDPAEALEPPPGMAVYRYSPVEISWGISFQPTAAGAA